jgi:pyrimidine operon attenuation protein/uracil phosphoribosyltransferase
MNFKQKATILDEAGMKKAVNRIAHEIVERNNEIDDVVIVGIRNRGEHIGRRIREKIGSIVDKKVRFGVIDITLYRDDLTEVAQQPVLKETSIDFDITGKRVVLVDDVLFTGRTIRCAMDQLIDFGRPAVIQLAVLVDRGHRELPIRADYVGKNIPTAHSETIEVRLKEVDGIDEAVICEKSGRE